MKNKSSHSVVIDMVNKIKRGSQVRFNVFHIISTDASQQQTTISEKKTKIAKDLKWKEKSKSQNEKQQ